MAGTGGKREGAGRKPGSRGQNTKLAESLKAEFIEEYKKRKRMIWQALLDKAESGDVPAIKEANERAMGKVPQAIANDDTNPFIVQWLTSSPSPTVLADGPNTSTSQPSVG